MSTTVLGIGFLCFVSSPARGELRIPEAQAKKAALQKAAPEYPALAQQMNVTGKVELEASVNERGTVDSAKVTVGNPILGGAAIAAVKKWKFTPFMQDGKPTNAIVVLSFDFRQ